MDKIKAYLADWVLHFLKNKDIAFRRIEEISKDKNDFDIYVKFKDREQRFLAVPMLEDINIILNKLDKQKSYGIVVINNKNNLDKIIENWKKLTEYKLLFIYFVNPFSNLDKKWIICPHTHQRICDEASLKTGLKAMFETVDRIDEKRFLENI